MIFLTSPPKSSKYIKNYLIGRLKNDKEYAIFQNWLKTHPKVLNAQNKRVLHHFGGMLPLKSGLGFFVSAA